MHRVLERAAGFARRRTPTQILYSGGLGAALGWACIRSSWLIFLSTGLLALGFLLFAVPLLKGAWKTWWGKFIVTGTHAFVLAVALVAARNVVAGAIGLPTGSFKYTVGTVAALLYVPTWLILASFLTVVCGGLLVVGALALELPSLFSTRVRDLQRSLLGHLVGALSVALLSAMAFQTLIVPSSRVEPAIRRLAYLVDYEPATRYPGMPPGKRIRFIEGGVLSYAELTPDDAFITAEARK